MLDVDNNLPDIELVEYCNLPGPHLTPELIFGRAEIEMTLS